MRVNLVILLIVLAVNSFVDWYIWHQARHRLRNRLWARLQAWSAVVFNLALTVGIILPARGGSQGELTAKMWLLFTTLTVYFPKYLWVVFDLLAAIPTLWHGRRLLPLSWAGGVLAVGLFVALWWGTLFTRFQIQVNEVEIPIEGLPEEFDGYRIAQFSDLHTGTYLGDTAFVACLVDSINGRRPDLTVFTGDIVNRQSSEMRPFVATLSRLKAPDGVFAILGNHDYGDYSDWASPAQKQANMEELYGLYRQTGICLLRNETATLRRGADSVALIGVENIGDPPFKVYGSLPQAYPDVSDGVTKILLTHNPVHWTDSVAPNPRANIALTLSGHTHAMQLALGHHSPAAWRYKTWGGLYGEHGEESGKVAKKWLYVNVGAGAVGLPARIGTKPEITLLTLRKKKE